MLDARKSQYPLDPWTMFHNFARLSSGLAVCCMRPNHSRMLLQELTAAQRSLGAAQQEKAAAMRELRAVKQELSTLKRAHPDPPTPLKVRLRLCVHPSA